MSSERYVFLRDIRWLRRYAESKGGNEGGHTQLLLWLFRQEYSVALTQNIVIIVLPVCIIFHLSSIGSTFFQCPESNLRTDNECIITRARITIMHQAKAYSSQFTIKIYENRLNILI